MWEGCFTCFLINRLFTWNQNKKRVPWFSPEHLSHFLPFQKGRELQPPHFLKDLSLECYIICITIQIASCYTLIGLSFQKKKLQYWETMNKSWQVPHTCNCTDFEINFTPQNSPITYESFRVCASYLSSQLHSFPIPPFPAFLLLPLPSDCSLSLPIILSQYFY